MVDDRVNNRNRTERTTDKRWDEGQKSHLTPRWETYDRILAESLVRGSPHLGGVSEASFGGAMRSDLILCIDLGCLPLHQEVHWPIQAGACK